MKSEVLSILQTNFKKTSTKLPDLPILSNPCTPKQRLRLPLAALLSLLRRLRRALGIGIGGVSALELGQLFGLQLLHALLVGHRWMLRGCGLQEEWMENMMEYV